MDLFSPHPKSMNIGPKVMVYMRSGVLWRECKERAAVSLVRQGRAEKLENGTYRMVHWTDEEIDQMNQLALAKRAELPLNARAFYSSWQELFDDIDDGRRWRGQQSATRDSSGTGYSSLRYGPSVMVFAT